MVVVPSARGEVRRDGGVGVGRIGGRMMTDMRRPVYGDINFPGDRVETDRGFGDEEDAEANSSATPAKEGMVRLVEVETTGLDAGFLGITGAGNDCRVKRAIMLGLSAAGEGSSSGEMGSPFMRPLRVGAGGTRGEKISRSISKLRSVVAFTRGHPRPSWEARRDANAVSKASAWSVVYPFSLDRGGYRA